MSLSGSGTDWGKRKPKASQLKVKKNMSNYSLNKSQHWRHYTMLNHSGQMGPRAIYNS